MAPHPPITELVAVADRYPAFEITVEENRGPIDPVVS
jgi:hypothetical protein